MAQEWQQTGTASNTIGLGFAGVKCDTTTLATNPLEKTCELSGSGGSEVTVTLPAKANYTAAIFAADEAVGVTSIPSGTWNVKVNVTSAASSGSQIAEVHICRVNSSGVSQATIASATGLAVDAATTGVKSIDVTQGSAHSCSATDHFYVQVVVYSNSHGGTTIGITPNQLITDTITPVQTWSLAGTIAGQGTVTGDVKPVRRLAGTIAAASSFVGDLKPIRKLAGAISAASTFIGDLGPPFAKHVLAGTIAASALFGGDLVPTRQLAGSIAGQSTVAGDLKGQRKLAGTIGGQSTLTGDLVIASATHVLDGDIAAQSSFTGDLKVTRKLDSAARFVDEEVYPADNTTYDADANCHITFVWTNEAATQCSVRIRHVAWNSTVVIDCNPGGSDNLQLLYYDGSWHGIGVVVDVFTEELEYRVDVYAHGDNIKIDVEDVEKINERCTYNQGVAGGQVRHQLATNDLVITSRSHPDGIGGKGEFTGDLKGQRQLAGTIGGQSTLTGDLKVTRKLDSSKRLVDYYYDPPSTTVADSEADFHLQVTWTTVDQTTLSIFPRYVSFNDKVEIALRSDGVNALGLSYRLDNVSYPVKSIDQVFVDDTEYTADIYGHGDTIKIDIDSVEKINESVPFHTDEEGCRIDHQAEIADIEFFSYSHPDGIGGKGEFTGDLKVTRELAGTIAAQSTFIGDLEISTTTQVLQGTIAGQAAFSGDLKGQRLLAGAIGGQSTFTGDLVIASATHVLDGDIVGQSAFTGDAVVTRKLAGHVAGQSTIVGDLKRDVRLVGTIAGASTFAGDLVIAGAFPTGFDHKVALTIDKDDISADLDDWTMAFDQSFSSVLTQADGPLDADGAAAALDGGGDIRFSSDEAGTTRLACDIRNFETDNTPANATCEIAVKIAFVSSTADTVIWMWWGKSGETQPAAAETYGQHAAYDSDHAAAWNFRDWVDRTENEYDADTTTAGDPAVGQTGGPVGQHAYFDGDDIRSTSSSITHGIGTGDFAFEVVVARVSDTGTWDAMLGSGTYDPAIYVRNGGAQWSFNWANSGSAASEAWPAGTDFHHIVIHRAGGGTVGIFRRDGAWLYTSTTSYGTTCPNNVLHFGSGFANTGECADVQIAEFRLHTDIRSDAWWDANYANLFNTSGFLTFGEIDAGETALAGAITGQSTFAGNLKRDVKIAGAIAAQSTLTGDLVISSVTWELAGAVAGQSTFAGDLKPQRELAGAIAGTSSFVGDLKVDRQLAGAIGGTSTFAGDLKVTRNLAGTVAGQSTFTGDLKGQRKLAGSITGQSTFVGDLVVSGVEILAGDIVGQSTFAGDLKPQRELDGTIAGQSTFTGDLKGQRVLAGAVTAQSTLTGDLVPQRQLAGSIDAQSTLSGDLKVDRQLAGSVAGQSTFTGTLAQTHRLVGAIAGQSTFAGDLILDSAALPLAGSIAGQSTFAGALTQEMRLVGGVAAQSTFAGDLKVTRKLAGTVAGQSTFTGDLKRDVKLAGAITAQSTLTGDLAPLRKLAGVIAGQSTFLGDLTLLEGTWVLDGHIAGQSTFAGDLKQTHALSGAITGQSTVAGDLKVQRKLAGSIDAQSTFAGDLQIAQAVWSLQGAIAGQSTFSGEMTGTLRLVGVIAAASEFTGHLTQHMVLAGAIQGQSTFVGNLRWLPLGAWPLVGHITGQGEFTGTLLSIYRGRISGSVGSNRVGGTVGSNRVGGSLNDGDSGTVV